MLSHRADRFEGQKRADSILGSAIGRDEVNLCKREDRLVLRVSFFIS